MAAAHQIKTVSSMSHITFLVCASIDRNRLYAQIDNETEEPYFVSNEFDEIRVRQKAPRELTHVVKAGADKYVFQAVMAQSHFVEDYFEIVKKVLDGQRYFNLHGYEGHHAATVLATTVQTALNSVLDGSRTRMFNCAVFVFESSATPPQWQCVFDNMMNFQRRPWFEMFVRSRNDFAGMKLVSGSPSLEIYNQIIDQFEERMNSDGHHMCSVSNLPDQGDDQGDNHREASPPRGNNRHRSRSRRSPSRGRNSRSSNSRARGVPRYATFDNDPESWYDWLRYDVGCDGASVRQLFILAQQGASGRREAYDLIRQTVTGTTAFDNPSAWLNSNVSKSPSYVRGAHYAKPKQFRRSRSRR